MSKEHKKIGISKNLIFSVLGIFVLLISFSIIWVSSLKIPDFRSFEDRKVVNSTKIYDRTGEILLYDIHQDVKRTDVPFEKMSANIKNATVAIEDSEFYNHGGIRLTSIVRAALSNLFQIGIGGGGSTITQQLVKNTLLTQKVSYVRKIKEWVLAIKIDNSMPKEKILEYYLNENPYGGNVYGIEEASKTYFNKSAQDLTLAESAYLAAIPQSPTLLSPYGKNRDKLETRKNLVLSRMLEIKFISQKEYDDAKGEIVTFIPQATSGIKAPHFVFFIKDYLEQKYGTESVEGSGFKVITTLDYSLQEKGEAIVKEGALKNEKDWNGKNAGLVAIDPKTGQILTMVGSRDYFDKTIDGNYNIATAWRQPGSSFKPFIYATAFNKGFTPNTVLFDLPTEFQTTCDAYGNALPGHSQANCYKPEDYDGKYRGPMSLRDALAQSINIVAVKLFYLAGLSDSLKTAEDMGISTLTDISRYGLTLVIGGGEVSLLDITSAYGVFANNGIRNQATGILRVEDINGKVLEEYNPNPKEVLPKNTALIISNILSDNVARTPTFGSSSPLVIPGREVAVKTGTTNNNKDAWTIGYTPSIAVGVWAGNNDNKPMKKGGSAVAGPIWNNFMNEALKILPTEKLEKPNLEVDPKTVKPALRGYWQGNENFFIDKISGKLASEFTPKETTVEKVITNVHTILYWVDRNNILGPSPSNPSDDSQFSHWEIPIQNWWAQNNGRYPKTSWAEKPTQIDNVHTDVNKPIVTIVEPNNITTYPSNQRIQLKITSTGYFPLQKIDIFINDTFMDTVKAPFYFSFTPEELDSLRENNELKIISYDTAYNRGETTSTFKVSQ
ncbi:MAG: PBP1A family penicillin-binding protein [Candidatus Paceibacterota bacterium]